MEHLDPQVRDIYVQIGLAISLAQTIEQQIATILTCASESLKVPEDYDDEFATRSRKPLGRLVAELRNADLPPSVATRLDQFTSERNEVAHRYLSHRCEAFQSVQGRQQMLDELDQITERFDDLQEYFVQLMARWHEHETLDRDTLTECINRREAGR